MAKEIERKFLVQDMHPLGGLIGETIIQGYMKARKPSVRVRTINDKKGF